MRKLAVLLALAVALSLSGFAQTSSGSADQSKPDQGAANQSATDQGAANQSSPDQGANQGAASQSATDQGAANQSSPDQGANQGAANQSATDQGAANQSSPDQGASQGAANQGSMGNMGNMGQSEKPKSKKGTKKAAGPATLSGCLSGPTDEGAFVLKNGRHPKGVEVGGNDQLKDHVGHEVKLTGSWEKSGAAIGENEANEGKEEANEGKEKEKAEKGGPAERHFKVDSIQHVADTCTAAAGKKGGKKGKGKASTAPGL